MECFQWLRDIKILVVIQACNELNQTWMESGVLHTLSTTYISTIWSAGLVVQSANGPEQSP